MSDDRDFRAVPQPDRQTPPDEPKLVVEYVENTDKRPDRRLMLAIVASMVLLTVIAAAVLGSGAVSDRIVRLLRYAGDDTVGHHFAVYTANDYAQADDLLAVASVSGLALYEDDGSEVLLSQLQMDTPVLKTNGRTALAYDVAGTGLTVIHSRKGTLLNMTAAGALLDADLSDGGAIGYAVAEDGYKTVLTVCNAAMQETYKWYSSTQYFNQCAVSQNGSELAAVAVGQADNAFASTAYLFATDEEEPLAVVQLGNELILELGFVDERTLCAVGEHSLQYFDFEGKYIGQYSYPAGTLAQFDLAGDGFQVLAVNMNKAGNACTLLSVDCDGKQLAALDLTEEIADLSVCGRYLAVLTNQSVRVYDEKLRLCGQSSEIGMASRVCARADGTALLIGGSETQLFVP